MQAKADYLAEKIGEVKFGPSPCTAKVLSVYSEPDCPDLAITIDKEEELASDFIVMNGRGQLGQVIIKIGYPPSYFIIRPRIRGGEIKFEVAIDEYFMYCKPAMSFNSNEALEMTKKMKAAAVETLKKYLTENNISFSVGAATDIIIENPMNIRKELERLEMGNLLIYFDYTDKKTGKEFLEIRKWS